MLDFPNLHDQAVMLNRIFSLIEETGTPSDRVISDEELAAYLAEHGFDYDTFVLGHDYRSRDIAKFFELAERDGIALNEAEIFLRELLKQYRFIEGAGGEYRLVEPEKTLVSIPQVQDDDPTTESNEEISSLTRRSILRHELSHGEFFTNQAYRDYCFQFWDTQLNDDERTRFRAFFKEAGYREGVRVLEVNEMQAYMLHTLDPGIFSREKLGITQAHLDAMRDRFRADAPPSGLMGDAVTPITGALEMSSDGQGN